MSNISVRFQQPWALLLLLPALAAAVWVSLRAPGKTAAPRTHKICLGLRLLAIACAALLLSGAVLTSQVADTALVIAVDRSRSMAGAEEAVDAALRELAEKLPPDTLAALLSFGGEAATEAPLGRGAPALSLTASVNAEATDVGAALNAAASLLPNEAKKRVLLLTDGAFTDGDGLSYAAGLAGRGVRLDAMLLEAPAPEAEALISSLTLPADTAVGQPMQVGVTVESASAQGASLAVYDEQNRLSVKQVRLFPGENQFLLQAVPQAAGTAVFTVSVNPESDTMPENNALSGVSEVTASQRVLLAEGEGADASALADLLRAAGLETEVVSASQLPTDISGLCEYALTVLLNVDALALPPKAAARLEEYVTVYGRSLLAAGGKNTFLYGNMKDTALEAVLPVDMEVSRSESQEPVALLLLLDNSASMEGTAIVMAKRGAIRSVEALHSNDFAGVITFSTEHSVLSPLTGMENRERLIADVAALGTVMGTQYTGALLEAEQQLLAFDRAEKKHVILLSDGNPSDTGYEEIIARMAENGITLSAIALGKDVDREVMERLAEMGQGRCYIVESSYDLPAIMLADTVLTQVDPLVEGEIRPTAEKQSGLTNALPVLGGYLRTAPKPDAEVLLWADEEAPLFARRRVGSGMTAVFASDLAGPWTDHWYRDETARQALAQMLRGLLPASHQAGPVSAWLETGGTRCLLTVAAEGAEDAALTAEITPPQGEPYSVSLSRGESGLWQREIPNAGPGRYTLALGQWSPEGVLVSETVTAAAGGWSQEFNAFRDRVSRREGLQSLCAAAGGETVESVDQFLAAPLTALPVERDPGHALALICFFSALLELLLRKLRPRWLN